MVKKTYFLMLNRTLKIEIPPIFLNEYSRHKQTNVFGTTVDNGWLHIVLLCLVLFVSHLLFWVLFEIEK